MVASGPSADLLVAGRSDDAVERLAERIASCERDFDVATVTDPETVPAAAEAEEFDVLVTAPSDGWPEPRRLLDDVREREPGLPVLFVVEPGEDVGEVVADSLVDLHVDGSVGGPEALGNRLQHLIDASSFRRRFGDDRPGFGTIVDNFPGMVYRAAVRDPWPMLYVGGQVEDITGYPPSALETGEVVWGEDVIHPEDAERAERAVMAALEDDTSFEITYRIRTADGETKELWERGVGVYDGDEAIALDGFIMEASEGPAADR